MGDAEALYSHFRITIALNPVVGIARILNSTRILLVMVDFIGNAKKKKKKNERDARLLVFFTRRQKKFFWYQTLFCNKQLDISILTQYINQL